MSKIFPSVILDKRTSLGSYPLVYEVRGEIRPGVTSGAFLCRDCAARWARDGVTPRGRAIVSVTAHIHYEGSPIECEDDGCGEEIESAYGDPEAE